MYDYFYIEMLIKEVILKYNHREKSMKIYFIIHAEMEPLLEKIGTCHSNPENSSTTKINNQTFCGYSLFTHCSFDAKKTIMIIIEERIARKTFLET